MSSVETTKQALRNQKCDAHLRQKGFQANLDGLTYVANPWTNPRSREAWSEGWRWAEDAVRADGKDDKIEYRRGVTWASLKMPGRQEYSIYLGNKRGGETVAVAYTEEMQARLVTYLNGRSKT